MLRGAIALAGAAMLLPLVSGRALALDASAAETFVRETVDEVLALVRSSASARDKADRFQAIMERRGAMENIARFAIGKDAWGAMSGDQQARYTEAFSHYLATAYARRFSEYSGQEVEIGRSRDLGSRGVEVGSVVQGAGQAPIEVVWYVSDRPGRTVLVDLKIEGVSMVITLRDEIGEIHKGQGRDIEK
ncbi:MAG: ABC transporter substrate-binding protein, partial [Pseudomonadota bacterium]